MRNTIKLFIPPIVLKLLRRSSAPKVVKQEGSLPKSSADKIVQQTCHSELRSTVKLANQLSTTCAIHALAWQNVDPQAITAHRKVFDHFELAVNYTRADLDHGDFLESVLRHSKEETILFADIDAIPLRSDAVSLLVDYAVQHDSFIGPAQVSNQFHPATHIYAAPSFLCITKSAFTSLGKPSLNKLAGRQDIAEGLSYCADHAGFAYRTIFPTGYEQFRAARWRLSNYGHYGIGTVYGSDLIYHLFKVRTNGNLELFLDRCNRVILGETDWLAQLNSSTELFSP